MNNQNQTGTVGVAGRYGQTAQVGAQTPAPRTVADQARLSQAGPRGGTRTSVAPAEPGFDQSELLALPFEDPSRRFWEKASAFCIVGVLGLVAAALVAWRGWNTGLVAGCGVACGATSSWVVSRAIGGKGLRCMLSATLLSALLMAFLLELGRFIFMFPSHVQSVAIAIIGCYAAFCVASVVSPVVALTGPSQWLRTVGRVAAGAHRAAGVAILTSAYLLAVVPASVFLALTLEYSETRLTRAARRRFWSWLTPLNQVCRMSARMMIRPRKGGNELRMALTILLRRLAVIPLIILGMTYALLVVAAHTLAKLSSNTISQIQETDAKQAIPEVKGA